MEKTSPWAALYFVALMTFGNYVLFNLLVAILVEGFSAERLEREQREKEAEEKQKVEQEGRILTNKSITATTIMSQRGYCEVHDNLNNAVVSGNRIPAPVIITHTAATPEVLCIFQCEVHEFKAHSPTLGQ